ncbi:hypothetical protein [Sphingopyxis sp.]|uniref:hypothetical protein n=1 Tax=Sphingopyxis sp. TaxID=1908224 RepID=UPI002B48D765|nr:hypothetical protein [Sphingopyxis sp.]HJS11515.1 hypothetical protein [Sphingopyxis sp.]
MLRAGLFRRAVPGFSIEEFTMKMILAAAILAATAFAAPSFAQEKKDGHYEWQERYVPGPNKSNIASRTRVWVRDAASQMAHCDCAMMKSDAADCMKSMFGKATMPSEG